MRYGQPFAILLLDIDHFKRINDGHEHLAGDQMLKRFVTTVRQSLRNNDLVGRFGGEEFLVLLPSTDLTAAHALAERVRLAIELMQACPDEQACTVSIGVTCVEAGDASFDDLIARADKALYRAKAEGRNQVLIA